MDWKSHCYELLDAENMFESPKHRTRFRELVDCFSPYPFFTRGLCKCIYLSAWDEKHFCVMLETLTDLSLGNDTTTREMSIQGDILTEKQTDDEYYVYLLSCSLLDNKPYPVNDISQLQPEIRYIIRRALKAADLIDSLDQGNAD
jgi:hypothetical protein